MAQASYLSLYNTTQTIGREYRFQIYSYDNSYLHKVVLKCGSYSKTWDRVKGGVETAYEVPLNFANAMPNATSMTGTLTVTTYQSNYSTKIGSSDIENVTFYINYSTMIPDISATITEAVDGISEQFGAYVQGKSKINMNITGTGIYGSTIRSYSSSINDVVYTENSYTTGYLKSTTTSNYEYKQWTAKVTDSRGQYESQTGSYKILTYHNPKINNFEVIRCTEDGTENDNGTYIKVISSASIKPCNDGVEDKNTKSFKLSYKMTTEDTWTVIDITGDSYDLSDERILSGFDVNNTYNFKLEAIDFFGEDNKGSKTTIIGSSDNIMDFHHSGKGMAIGKASELEDVFDIGWLTKLTGGLTPVVLEADTDLNDIKIPNFYTGENISEYNYLNAPFEDGTFDLQVYSCGEQGQVKQVISRCHKNTSVTYERFFYQDTWGEWKRIDSDIDSYNFDTNGYIRYINGFQIAWNYMNVAAGGTAWAGTSIYYSDHSIGDWVVPFTAIYFAKATTNSTTFWCTEAGYNNTSTGTIRCFRPNEATGNIGLRIIAIGRWK